MKKVVHFGATSIRECNGSMALTPMAQSVYASPSVPASLKGAEETFVIAPALALVVVPMLSAPTQKRSYQSAFGAAGVRLAQAPRPLDGELAPAKWI